MVRSIACVVLISALVACSDSPDFRTNSLVEDGTNHGTQEEELKVELQQGDTQDVAQNEQAPTNQEGSTAPPPAQQPHAPDHEDNSHTAANNNPPQPQAPPAHNGDPQDQPSDSDVAEHESGGNGGSGCHFQVPKHHEVQACRQALGDQVKRVRIVGVNHRVNASLEADEGLVIKVVGVANQAKLKISQTQVSGGVCVVLAGAGNKLKLELDLPVRKLHYVSVGLANSSRIEFTPNGEAEKFTARLAGMGSKLHVVGGRCPVLTGSAAALLCE